MSNLINTDRLYLDNSFRRRLLFIAGLLFTIATILPAQINDTLFEKIDYRVYDFLTDRLPDKKPSDLITIIDIDERSIRSVGQWPWPRYKIAYLMKNTARAAAVGVDILFPEEDRTSVASVKKSFKKDFGINLNISNLPAGMNDNDKYMAHILSRGTFVLPNYFMFGETTSGDKSCVENPLDLVFPKGSDFFKANDVICNLKLLTKSSAATGFVNSFMDSDGVTRRVLSLKAFNVDVPKLYKSLHGAVLEVGEKRINLNRNGTMNLRFKNSETTYRRYSAVDLLYGEVPAEALMGKIVLIGVAASGIDDTHIISSRRVVQGIDIHATFIDNILNEDFFIIPIWAKWLNILIVAVFGITFSYYSGRAKSLGVIFVMPAVFFAAAGISYLILISTNIYVSPTPLMLSIVIVCLPIAFLNYFIKEKEASAKTKMLALAQQITIRSMANVAETRDPETGAHILRTQDYVRALAQHLYDRDVFPGELNDEIIEALYLSAPLHDVGKVGIPDSILLKPARLTEGEFEIMKTHASLGGDIIGKAEEEAKGSDVLYYGRLIAESHHERWDGKGYPEGLNGEDIPLAGRLMAVADVYDALISKRHYKDAMSHEKAVEIITEGHGNHFDPKIVDAFLEIEDEIKRIAEKHKDG